MRKLYYYTLADHVSFFEQRWKAILLLTIPFAIIFGAVDVIAELPAYSLDVSLALSTELLDEKGPEYDTALVVQLNSIKAYSKYLRNEDPGILRTLAELLFGDYTLRKYLDSATEILLQGERGDIAAQDAIRQAGLEINKHCVLLKQFKKVDVIWMKYPETPTDFLETVERSIQDCNESVRKLEENKSSTGAFSYAKDACERNRRAMLLLYLANVTFGNEDYVKQFQKCVQNTYSLKMWLAGKEITSTSTREKSLLLQYAASEERRGKILQFLLDGRRFEARSLMLEAIAESLKSDQLTERATNSSAD